MNSMYKDELDRLKEFCMSYRDRMAKYSMIIKVDGASEKVDEENDAYFFKLILNNSVIYKLERVDESSEESMKSVISCVVDVFDTFKALPSSVLNKVMVDRAVSRLSESLLKWPGRKYTFPHDEDDDWSGCPIVNAYIDEFFPRDSSINRFLIQEISMDNNGNIKFVGRVVNEVVDVYGDEEYYTYLGSLMPSDLELIRIPEYVEQNTEADSELAY